MVGLLLPILPLVALTPAQGAPSCGTGATLRVDPADSSSYSTIGAALAAASPGDRITVADGSYAETPTITLDRIALVGDSMAVRVESGGLFNIAVAADGVCLSHLTLAGGATDALVAHLVDVLDVADVAVEKATGAGFLITDSTSISLLRVSTIDIGVNGVVLARVAGGALTDSTIHSHARGVHFDHVTDAVLRGNLVSEIVENGIVIDSSAGPTLLENNRVRDGRWDVWVFQSADVRALGNDLSAFTDLGLRIESSARVLVQGGIVHDARPASNDGIHVRESRDVTVDGVLVRDLVLNGIYASDTEALHVLDNRVDHVGRGLHVLRGMAPVVEDNEFFNTRENGLVLEDVTGPSVVTRNALLNNTWSLWVLRSDHSRVTDTRIDSWRDRGLRVEGSFDSVVANVTIGGQLGDPTNLGLELLNAVTARVERTEITNVQVNGVRIGGGRDIDFVDNRIHHVARAMHLTDATDVRILRNQITELGENGIVVEPGTGVLIKDNVLDHGGIGIWFIRSTGPGNRVEGNSVSGFVSSGISLDAGTRNVVVEANTVTANHRGLKLLHGSPASPTSDNYFGNNTVTGNSFGVWSEDTYGQNSVFGGKISQNSVCDFWLVGQTSLRVEKVDFRPKATTNDESKMVLVNNKGSLQKCKESGPPAPPPPPSGTKSIFAKALTDHECNAKEWHFVITQLRSADSAPGSIRVEWANGAIQDVPLGKVAGKVAHYTTRLNLDSAVVSANAVIYSDWNGQFNLSHGPC